MRMLHNSKHCRLARKGAGAVGHHCRRVLSLLLCVCMLVPMICNFDGMTLSSSAEYTNYALNRIADAGTMNSYVGKLLSEDWGSRYAGRVWTDKSVFAYGSDIALTNNYDGYEGKVSFNSDFGTVFSALTSSQVVNEYPPAPIDLVIALDMSASMAQDTRFPINDDNYKNNSAKERSMADRIKNSRIQQTLDAVNSTIDSLMKQNKENRVSVVVYGAGAAVLMPLAHYARVGDAPYLTVSGMETLYDLDDLKIDDAEGWVWVNNRDACYTIKADAMYSNFDNPTFAERLTHTVSNNVDNRNPRNPAKDHIDYTEVVKANPGYPDQSDANHHEFSKDEKQLTADEYVGYFTNTQGGVYLAYAQLAQSKETTFTAKISTGEDVTVARIPAAIIMTDGGANFAFNEMDEWNKFYGVHSSAYDNGFRHDNSATDHTNPSLGWTMDSTDFSHRLGENVGDEWYNVYLPGQFDDECKITSLYNIGVVDGTGKLNTMPYWDNAGIFYSNDNDPFATGGTILQLIMTAAYMKSVVQTHYTTGWDDGHVTKDSRSDLLTFTMSVDSKNVPQWGRLRLYPSLDPANYLFSSDRWSNDEFSGELESGTYTPGFERALRAWEDWKSTGQTSIVMAASGSVANMLSFEEGYKDERFNVPVSNADVISNIVYTNGFFDIASGELVTKFQQILSEITGNVFVPVSGDNDAGVGDSVTYQDPLGEYMELKHGVITVDGAVTGSNENSFDMSMLFFGEMHGLVRAGVYDYQWNNAYMRNNKSKPGYPEDAGRNPDSDPLRIGWYKGDAETAVYSYESNGLPKGCTSAKQAWAEGWVLRFNYKTLAEFVPVSGITDEMLPTEVPEQIRNTVYTCYRFADSQAERNRLRRNPVYGDGVPQDLVDEWDAYYAEHGSYPVGMDRYKGYPGVFRLSDIRVWAEHTGDFIDQTGAITPEDESGYDDSLYINIPVAAVPTQLAEITLGADGPIAYKDNLGNKKQSTPIRLFYAVGLTEDLILRDSGGRQTGVDVAKISGEYIASHSDPETGNISFISNWYSNTVYRGYTSDESSYGYSTRGDAAVSFSPDVKNRYYLFQKALPLIAHAYRVTDASGNVAPVDRADGQSFEKDGSGNSRTTWETVDGTPQSAADWVGGEFIGTYEDEAAFKAALGSKQQLVAGSSIQYIKDDKGYYYPLPADITDAIITYTKDQLSNVDSDESGKYKEGSNSFSSDDYFFLCIEYYLPTEGVGKDIEGNDAAGTRAVRKINRMIARKGSAFGSGLHSKNINNGDMLCWSDINGNCNLEIEYNSRTDTGDNTRGRPTLEKLTLTGDDLRAYLKKCGLSETLGVTVTDAATGAESFKSYLDLDCEYWENVVQADRHMAALIAELKETPEVERQEKFDEMFDWSVSAKTGGIRVGDMYNNVQPKGGSTAIEEGSTEFYAGNKTHTANNFYVPTLSETSTAGEGMVINNFLGNNGRMEIANDNLIVTKTLTAPDGYKLTAAQDDELFNYQVYVQGWSGERFSQRLKWNPFSRTWQRRVETLDILTDNSSLLVDTSGKRALFCRADGGEPTQIVEEFVDGVANYYYADENGQSTGEPCNHSTDDFFYLYLPGDASELVYHLFASTYDGGTTELDGVGTTAYYPPEYAGQLPEGDNSAQKFEEATKERPAGSREYWSAQAELIPYNEVHAAESSTDDAGSGIAVMALEAENGGARWDHDFNHGETAMHQKLDKFVLATVIPDSEGVESTVYSPFSSRTQYMTAALYFGYKAELTEHLASENETFTACSHLDTYKLDATGLYDQSIPTEERSDLFNAERRSDTPAKLAANTAMFTLKNGEGLLLTGLGNDVTYRFTEDLTKAQLAQGHNLKDVNHIEQPDSDPLPDRSLNDETGIYSVFGNTDYFTEQTHYTNTVDPELFVLTKKVVDDDNKQVDSSTREFTFTVTFTPTDSVAMVDVDDTLHYWKGSKDTWQSTEEWTDGKGNTYKMPKEAPRLDGYEQYLTDKTYRLKDITPDEGKDGHTYTVKLKANEAVVFYGLIAGTQFTVTEEKDETYPVVKDEGEGVSNDGYTKSGTILRVSEDPRTMDPRQTPNRADFTDLMQSGLLTVEKYIHDADRWSVEEKFEFTVTLTAEKDQAISASFLTVTKFTKTEDGEETSETLTVYWKETEDGGKVTALTAVFELMQGQRIVIDGIPYGTEYTVAETNTGSYNLEHVADNSEDKPGDDGNYLIMNRNENSVSGTVTKEQSDVFLLFDNAKPIEMPFTGGFGLEAFYAVGAVLLLASGAVCLCRKRDNA